MTAAARLTEQEAAVALAISVPRLRGIAERRGWRVVGGMIDAADVEREARTRDKANGGASTRGDTFTKAGAERLADKIRAYWRKRGRRVEVWVEPTGIYLNALRTAQWFVVKSNMRNGMPPRG